VRDLDPMRMIWCCIEIDNERAMERSDTCYWVLVAFGLDLGFPLLTDDEIAWDDFSGIVATVLASDVPYPEFE